MGGKEVFVRSLEKQDFDAWQPLWYDYLNFYENNLSDVVTQNTWNRLTTRADMVALGAFNDMGMLLGFAHLLIHPNTWNIGECCYLEDLFVSPTARRQGVAKRLMDAVYNYAKEQKCNRVYWMTARDNEVAQSLYKQYADEQAVIQFRSQLGE
ncbi:GNAT family N-acetyltransferase [Pelistega europaea]|uniref:GNAT family N-acetyltransferase n=1 Tax=Pelistega europaea TaxID=106147 RepID=A0A7Y4LBB6_9BURK|nr:GNAT family N-acetyltransferase [Pelistega europaea]NOL49401.1 GNAT family N-acetyltransferase [Pelistega europaea]